MIFGKNRWARNPRRERALAHLVLMLMPDIKIKAHFIELSHRMRKCHRAGFWAYELPIRLDGFRSRGD